MAKAEIRNHIRRLRFEHGEMTQEELARRVACTRQTTILPEHGRCVPSLALALRIAGVFRLPVDQIFEIDEPA